MLAGAEYQEKLTKPGSRLRRMLEQSQSDDQIVEEFYLAAYSRLPEPDESAAITKLIASRRDREEALRDFVWAVLCSREFAENH
jgi:hypothetical protein